MTHHSTHAATKEAARAFVTNLARPEGMTRPTYEGIRRVLDAIVQSYPKAYPSIIRISARSGIPERTVKRLIARAIKEGWLFVEPDAGVGRTTRARTNRYFVPDMTPKWPDVHGATSAPKEIHQHFVLVPGASLQEPSALGSPLRSPCGLAEAEGRTLTLVQRWEPERERQVAEETPPRLSRRPRPQRPRASAAIGDADSGRRAAKRTPKPPPAWRQLAEYFVTQWNEVVVPVRPKLRETRVLESLNQCRTYHGVHFAGFDELELRALVDRFVTQVRKGDLRPKPGQSAWMLFTGSWGRGRRVVVGDPYAAYRNG